MVGMRQFELAKDKIMMGAERKSMVMSEDEKKLNTAYHEAGHAIVGRWCPSMIRSTRSASSRVAARSV
jgi:cell division protease FtsH